MNKVELPHIYLINLDRSVQRYEVISQKLSIANVAYERFSAIDGYKLDITNLQTQYTFPGELLKGYLLGLNAKYLVHCAADGSIPLNLYGWRASAGELGCFCSHLTVWHKAVASGEGNIIIFEDDMYPLDNNSFKQSLTDFVEHLPESFDVAFIDLLHVVRGELHEIENNSYVKKPSDDFLAWGAHAYMLSTKGVNKLLSYSFYNQIEDVFIWNQFNQGDLEIYVSAQDFIGVGAQSSILFEMGRVG